MSKHFPENGPAVYASGYTLEETALETISFPTVPVKGVVAWSKAVDNPFNKAFIEAMEEAGRNASIFSLLGWESASIAIEALNLMREAKQNGKIAVEQLKSYSFESPRGRISFHDASNHSVSPLFQVSLVKNSEGYCELSVDRTLTDTTKTFDHMSAESLEEATTGWYNSYTCI
jgi:branched-chain amino acid transport system substrate-binding protein